MAQPIKKALSVNLSSPDRGQEDLGVEISVNESGGGLFSRLFGSRPQDYSITIEQIEADTMLEFKPSAESFVSLVHDGVNHGDHLNITSETIAEVKVMADTSRIADCRQRENGEGALFSYTFTVVVRRSNGETAAEYPVFVEISLQPVKLAPSVSVILEETVEYSSQLGVVEIGTLQVANSSPDLRFTPAIDMQLMLDIACEGRVPCSDPDVIRLGSKDGKCRTEIKKLTPGDRRTVEIKTMNGTKHVMVIPIYLDMTCLSNPIVSKEDLMVSCTWSYNRSYDPSDICDGKREVEMIELLQDSQEAELKVEIDGVDTKVRNGASVMMPTIEFYSESQVVVDRIVKLRNLATDTSRPGAGVKICNLSIRESIESAIVRDRDNNLIDRLFVKDDSLITTLSTPTGKTLPNGPGSECRFMITFDAKRVMKVLDTDTYRFFSVVTVEFDYIENNTGESYSNLQPKKFRFEMRFPLYLKPDPKWLCIDYGTSAIVCKYGNELVDLRSRKASIIKKAVKRRELQVDTLEQNTPFLSSDLLLHTADRDAGDDVPSLCSQQERFVEQNYDRLAVFLSPTSSMMVNETLRQLPCLKLLVGNETLPSNPSYEQFTYTVRGNDSTLTSMTAKEAYAKCRDNSLLVIDNVFRESYDALFRYFILPQVQDINRVNRVVLTYPNTYTPHHLAALSKIIRKAVPSLRELKFISESDAVAAYYLEHWSEYHPEGADPDADETILVYDMGAGTLDLSLIKKTRRDGVMTMDIVAKIGTCQAGNYLDFVLADIVCALAGGIPLAGSMALPSTSRAATADISKSRNQLKDFVKNVLKPQLLADNMNETLKVNIGEEIKDMPLTIGRVLQHPLFLDFLEECTNEILRHLVNFSGMEDIKIDTVLMSGRSSLLNPLKFKLKYGIMQINGQNGKQAEFVRLDEPRNLKATVSRQKLAVSEGAMSIVMKNYFSHDSKFRITGRRIYASFGVAYRDNSGWKYHELVNYRDIPRSDNDDFRSRRFNIPGELCGVNNLTIIQSYLDEKMTCVALNKGNRDYIAEMESITLDGGPQPPLMMRVTPDNNIMLYIGDARTRGRSPKGDDLSSEQIKRSIWPVTI